MGLHEGDLGRPKNRFLHIWLLPILAAAIGGLLALFGDAGREWFAYDRSALDAGQIWRLLSAHFVHLSNSHLLLNVAGLALIWYLIVDAYSRGEWLFITLVVILGIDLGFWFFEPNLVWYVGLSGMLHGLLSAGLVMALRPGRPELWFLAAGLVAKLTYEHFVGPLPGSESSSGGAVIVAAHAYGTISGVVAAGLIWVRVRRRASI